MNKQNYLSDKNRYFKNLIDNKRIYLVSLFTLISSYVILTNFFSNKETIMGAESYFHLSKSLYQFNPWKLIIDTLPSEILFLTTPILTIISILLFIKLAKNIELSNKFTFIFLTFLSTTPAFIFTGTTITSYSLFITLILAGSVLITEKNKKINLISPLFFVTASFFDMLSTCLILIILINRFYFHKKEKLTIISLILVSITFFINLIFLKQPFISGPFQNANLITGLITDLGGTSGVGFFMILLALFGITITWKRKKLYSGYIFLPLLITSYILNTQTILLLSIVIVLFASVGFIKLFEW